MKTTKYYCKLFSYHTVLSCDYILLQFEIRITFWIVQIIPNDIFCMHIRLIPTKYIILFINTPKTKRFISCARPIPRVRTAAITHNQCFVYNLSVLRLLICYLLARCVCVLLLISRYTVFTNSILFDIQLFHVVIISRRYINGYYVIMFLSFICGFNKVLWCGKFQR